MTIKTISYQKAFVVGPYLQERIGVEIELDSDDDPDRVFKEAQDSVNQWHKLANPHLEGTTVADVLEKKIDDQEQYLMDAEFAQAVDALSKIEFQEDAIKWMNNNGWTFNMELKQIANSKPKKQ